MTWFLNHIETRGPRGGAGWEHQALSAHPSAVWLRDGMGGTDFSRWEVTASFPNYHIWGNRWGSMWRNYGLLYKEGGACSLKKASTEHLHPDVLGAFGVCEAVSV